MCTEPTRYTTPVPRVAFHASARVCASGCAGSTPTAIDATIAASSRRRAVLLRPQLSLEIIEAPLNAMGECRVEVEAVAEVANQVGHGEAARLVKHTPDGERARRVGERRLCARQLAEGSSEGRQRHRPCLADTPLCPVERVGFKSGRDAFVEPGRNRR